MTGKCDREFVCEHCKGRFHSRRSPAERQAEYEARFPEEMRRGDQAILLCGTCGELFDARYRMMMAAFKVAEALAAEFDAPADQVTAASGQTLAALGAYREARRP